MTEFELDRSGVIVATSSEHPIILPAIYTWVDLDAFTQGYVEAAKQAHRYLMGSARAPGGYAHRDWRFSDLAPETLAAILKDCARGNGYAIHPWGRLYNDNAAGGACFWADRQRGMIKPAFPPLAPYLGDDGRVYLKEQT